MNRVCLTWQGPYQEESHREKSQGDGGKGRCYLLHISRKKTMVDEGFKFSHSWP